MQLIVTRPALQAAEWVRQLEALGIAAVALPLIAIAPVDAPEELAALSAAWHDLGSKRLVMFVSPNAVAHFFAQRPGFAQRADGEKPLGLGWPRDVLAGAPGPGTANALLALGVPSEQVVRPVADAAQFDSEALWQRLRHLDWRGKQALIVRGDGGREDFAASLRRHGATVAWVTAYRRQRPRFSAAEAAVLRATIEDPANFVWLFGSSEAIDNLVACAGSSAGAAWRASTAIATHPRIAARAAAVGFAQVVQTHPSLTEVVACIQSLRP